MWSALTRLFVRKPAFKPGPPSAPQLLFTDSCVAALQECLLPEIQKRHEGIAYLAGRTDGGVTIAAQHDHRIGMSFLTLGLITKHPITVSGCTTIETSFPGFAEKMKQLGASISVDAI